MSNRNTNIPTKIEDTEIIMGRIFDAPRELVWEVFTIPEHVAQWWAPGGYTIPVCTIDLRPGGVWHYCMRSPEGDEHWVKSVYLEIVEPERIAYVSSFADENAVTIEGLPEQNGTLTLSEYKGKTKLTVCIQFASAEELGKTMEMGFTEGFAETLNQLDDYLTNL